MKEMNDLISRQAAIDAIFSEPLYKSGMKKRDVDVVVPAIYEKIKALPPVQTEIIHCKECLYRQICSWKNQGATFCSFGKRGEQDG